MDQRINELAGNSHTATVSQCGQVFALTGAIFSRPSRHNHSCALTFSLSAPPAAHSITPCLIAPRIVLKTTYTQAVTAFHFNLHYSAQLIVGPICPWDLDALV